MQLANVGVALNGAGDNERKRKDRSGKLHFLLSGEASVGDVGAGRVKERVGRWGGSRGKDCRGPKGMCRPKEGEVICAQAGRVENEQRRRAVSGPRCPAI